MSVVAHIFDSGSRQQYHVDIKVPYLNTVTYTHTQAFSLSLTNQNEQQHVDMTFKVTKIDLLHLTN